MDSAVRTDGLEIPSRQSRCFKPCAALTFHSRHGTSKSACHHYLVLSINSALTISLCLFKLILSSPGSRDPNSMWLCFSGRPFVPAQNDAGSLVPVTMAFLTLGNVVFMALSTTLFYARQVSILCSRLLHRWAVYKEEQSLNNRIVPRSVQFSLDTRFFTFVWSSPAELLLELTQSYCFFTIRRPPLLSFIPSQDT
ncbi:hypothetical protein N658DRAFT_490803 [Parathielavia hyrcaniae]|uniref:Uncharacterized protein n=1 Tax=Parathielavia hyrcaniae TaxID=113614 RepID=A0AAN6QEY1_9PEZI|nr:hypothetical protein N658DRAFT_490803 [Parathielavia hyrcaniae]